MNLRNKLNANKKVYKKKKFSESIEFLKGKYPNIRYHLYSSKFYDITKEFLEDLNNEYVLCGVRPYDSTYEAGATIDSFGVEYYRLLEFIQSKRDEKDSDYEMRGYCSNRVSLPKNYDAIVSIFWSRVEYLKKMSQLN